MRRVDPGFDSGNLLTFQFRLPRAKYRDAAAMAAFFERVVPQLRAVPGVVGSALVGSTPFTGNWGDVAYTVAEHPEPAPGRAPTALWDAVSDGYFGTMRIPLVAGRDFDARDRARALPVAIVSRELAHGEWPGASALGKRIRPVGDSAWSTVVGVVADSRQRTLGEDVRPRLYVPVLQSPMAFSNVVARTTGDPLQLAPSVRAALWSVDPDQPVWSITSMDRLLARSMRQERFTTLLTGLFAALALRLAAVGVYGVMAYTVSQRTRAVGIRLAVGAAPRQVVALVFGRGLRVTAVATALGLAGALAATRLLRSQLFGVAPGDPVTFVAAAAVLAIVALLACYLPARRAAKVDAVVALRSE